MRHKKKDNILDESKISFSFSNILKKWEKIDPLLRYTAIIFVSLITIIFCLPFFFTLPNKLGLDFTKTGQIGDTLGGIMGPFIAIIAAGLTFLAFYIQYIANKQQRQDISIERFQNKFFELLKLHKENVTTILNSTKYKNNYFIEAFNDLRKIYFVVENHYQEIDETYKPNHFSIGELKENLVSLAFTVFWLGLDLESRRAIHDLHKSRFDSMFIAKLFEKFESIEKQILHPDDSGYTILFYQNLDDEHIDVALDRIFFSEHSSEMSYYYRHMFQTIKLIDEFKNPIFTEIEKYNYSKNLRAQLSNHEQILLYYNVLSPFGKPWLDIIEKGSTDVLNCYLHKYKMIKNIPFPLAKIGIEPAVKFKKEIALLNAKETPEELFEWHEITLR